MFVHQIDCVDKFFGVVDAEIRKDDVAYLTVLKFLSMILLMIAI